jgi:hypothetical protein
MILNYEKISRRNKKIWQNLCIFKKLYFSKFDCKKIRHIGATINTIYKKFQNISFENSSLEKHVCWEKKPPKRIIFLNAKYVLAHYMLFGPNGVITILTFYCMCSKHLSIPIHFYLIDLNMYINQFIVMKND